MDPNGGFTLQAHEYVRERVEGALVEARRIVDAMEMAAIPKCELEPREVLGSPSLLIPPFA